MKATFMPRHLPLPLLLSAAIVVTFLPATQADTYRDWSDVEWSFTVGADGGATIDGVSVPYSAWNPYSWDGTIPYAVKSGYAWDDIDESTWYPVTAIGDNALYSLTYAASSLYSISVPDTVTRIGDSAFQDFSSVTFIDLPEGLEHLGRNVFDGCNSLSYDGDYDGLKVLNGWVLGPSWWDWDWEHGTTISIQNADMSAAKGIAAAAFENCTTLSSAMLPVSLKIIPEAAFYGCTALTDIIVPASVTNIEAGAFSSCSSLTNITFVGNAPIIEVDPTYPESNPFYGVSPQCVVTVQLGTTGWGDVPGTWNGLPTQYAAAPATYTVTWRNDDGTLIDENSSWVYGAMPGHTDPTKEETAEFTYTFSHWTPDFEPVTSNATYRAVYTAERKTYCISWYNERGGWIGDTIVPYGTVPTRAAPAKAATAFHTYEFAGWSPTPVPVTGGTSYRATFTAIPKYAGSGTEADPFIATNKADLVALVSATNTLYVQLATGLAIDGPITVPATMKTLSIDMNGGTIAGANGDPAVILLGDTAFSAKGTGTISADDGVEAVQRPATITAANGVTITGLGGGGDAGPAVFIDGGEAITAGIAPDANDTWTLTTFAELASGSADGLDDAQVKVYAANSLTDLANQQQPMASGVVVTNKAPAVKVELEVTPPANAQFFRVGFGE